MKIYLLSKISDYKSDDLREMKCDTQQPGCIQFCHNEFAPISQARFFFFQVNNILYGTFKGHFFSGIKVCIKAFAKVLCVPKKLFLKISLDCY